MKSSNSFTIGQLADRFHLPTHVLRHWEDVGVLVPAGRMHGRRMYDESHARRISLILRGKHMGLRLAQIRQILDEPDHARHAAILRAHRTQVVDQIATLEMAKALLDRAIED